MSSATETGSASPTRDIAAFVAELVPDDVPGSLEAILTSAVIDSIGCAVYGSTTEACRVVNQYAVEQAGPAQASIWSSGGAAKVSMINAALSNGVAIHGFDFDDHSRAKIHPGAVVIAAAFAAGEHTGCSGRTLLAAIAAGYEVMNRASLAAGPNQARTKGWHLTGTTGTFAAAAATSVIFGLDAEQTASALGIAGSHSSGTWAFNAEGAMTKRLHAGLAAQSGIRSADLARRGFYGGASIFETTDGGFLKMASDDPRPSELTRDLGRTWRAKGACLKPYACCGSNHAAVDAVLDLCESNGLGADDIERVTVGVSRVVELQTGFPYRRSSVLNAQMSIRYNLAIAILDGAALVPQFSPERIADPAIDALIERIDVRVDPDMDAVYPDLYAGIVTLTLRDGRELTRRVDHSRGMPENPMTAEERDAKFRSLTSHAGSAGSEALLAELRTIFETPDIRGICETLRALSSPHGAS
ncbi:MmgE/PrpD family protein [Pelagibacterium montanilacus]|uniref:MmgE/PrpD family protein n=1 Tax=Pelagibacterium montanilacus TaxID=2185280 RepID=UPI000F8EF591|nr:MmgE/PrpD family protein [Pelagibacterium montanilacus]